MGWGACISWRHEHSNGVARCATGVLTKGTPATSRQRLAQRCVLAVLLVEANRPVSADQLAYRVWGDRVPPRARGTLYSYLSRLRQVLGPLAGVDLGRQPGGYILTIDPAAADLHQFHRLITQARAAEDRSTALAVFEQALGLWPG